MTEQLSSSITLLLMTEKGYRALSFIAEIYPEMISQVVIGRDPQLANDYAEEIIDVCEKVGLEYRERKTFKKVTSKYALAISWRWLIDDSVAPVIVLHDSILPKYRGFAPLISSLLNGEKEIGVSAIFAGGEYDSGPIIAQATSEISYPITIQQAIDLNNKNYRTVIRDILDKLKNGSPLDAREQNEAEASYSIWRDKFDYQIDWSRSSIEIRRMVDALGYPYKGAYSTLDNEKIIIERVEEIADVRVEVRDVGKVIFLEEGMPVVICGHGLLKIIEAYKCNNGIRKMFLPPKYFRMRFR